MRVQRRHEGEGDGGGWESGAGRAGGRGGATGARGRRTRQGERRWAHRRECGSAVARSAGSLEEEEGGVGHGLDEGLRLHKLRWQKLRLVYSAWLN